jgi:hypothetical protein
MVGHTSNMQARSMGAHQVYMSSLFQFLFLFNKNNPYDHSEGNLLNVKLVFIIHLG